MTVRVGLTGSIGMGKSTTAEMFADEGCAIWDADAAVHRLYSVGGPAVGSTGEIWPQAIVDGAVSRPRLKTIISEDASALTRIETIVHPLVAADRAVFLAETGADIAVFDIPLLFETGGDRAMDYTVVVSVDADTQRARVLARGTMTDDQFSEILKIQMSDTEKRARADYVIVTDNLDHARAQVHIVLADIRQRLADA